MPAKLKKPVEEPAKVWRSFQAHQSMLMDMVTRQTTQFEKAVMELVMNGIDAGATEIHVDLGARSLTVRDNGRGLPADEAEMLRCFQQVGAPHALNSHGHSTDAKFGRFRIGRLQMLGWGWVTFTSGVWELSVRVVDREGNHVSANDIDRRFDVGFDQVRHAVNFPETAAKVALDVVFAPHQVTFMSDQIAKWSCFSLVPIFVNGVQVSVHPDDRAKAWTLETDDAWFDLEPSGRFGAKLEIYMHGIFVCSQYAGKLGATGVVVAKKQMLVDFGRQGVSDNCPVWRSIMGTLREWAAKQLIKVGARATLTDLQGVWRAAVENQVEAYGGYHKLLNAPIFQDVNKFSRSWSQIMKMLTEGVDLKPGPNGKMLLSWGMPGNPVDTKIHESGKAYVLNLEMFSGLFDFKPSTVQSRLQAVLKRLMSYKYEKTYELVKLSDVDAEVEDTYQVYPQSRYTPEQLFYQNMLTEIYWSIVRVLNRDDSKAGRWARFSRARMEFGESGTAEAWTDGESYIAYDWRAFKKLLPLSVGSLSRIIRVVQHELCHDHASGGVHEHSAEFYQRYHDMQLLSEREVMDEMLAWLSTRFTKIGGNDFKKSDIYRFMTQFKAAMLGPKAIELWWTRNLRNKSELRDAQGDVGRFVATDVVDILEVNKTDEQPKRKLRAK